MVDASVNTVLSPSHSVVALKWASGPGSTITIMVVSWVHPYISVTVRVTL